MSCPDREAKLKDWVFEELPPAEAAEIERHVQGCADCARTLRELKQTHQALAAHLGEMPMPGHLVFLPERPRVAPAGWQASFWRAAAMGAAAAVVFLGITLGGLATWDNRPAQVAPAQSTGLSRSDVDAVIRAGVEQERARQRTELEAASQILGAQLRREQAQFRAVVLQQVRTLESAQHAVYKETQEQGAVVQTIARNMRAGQPGVREK